MNRRDRILTLPLYRRPQILYTERLLSPMVSHVLKSCLARQNIRGQQPFCSEFPCSLYMDFFNIEALLLRPQSSPICCLLLQWNVTTAVTSFSVWKAQNWPGNQQATTCGLPASHTCIGIAASLAQRKSKHVSNVISCLSAAMTLVDHRDRGRTRILAL